MLPSRGKEAFNLFQDRVRPLALWNVPATL
jgi:hypothetical protein